MDALHICLDDILKKQADTPFSSESDRISFSVQSIPITYSLQEAIDDSRFQKNLYGPFDNAKDAVISMLED